VTDALNAFVPGVEVRVAGRAGGPLADLTFAAKDLFDVAGHPTGGGNPDWARQHPLPTRHAWAVQTLLDAGATLIGKTITDEVSLGILGENPFYGTPLNTRAPGRVAGGSSSGSAAAVAEGICDTALGTDTGGSVRVPASFCGLYGIRPTHGRLPVTGMLPQAPRSDTTGWFARDARTFARVSGVMLGEPIAPAPPSRLIVAVDAFGLADPEVAAALQPMVKALSGLAAEVREDLLAPQGISVWARAQRTLQPWEAWLTFREWLDRDSPRMAFGHTPPSILGEVCLDDPVLVGHHSVCRNLKLFRHREYHVGLVVLPTVRPIDGFGKILVVTALEARVDPGGQGIEFFLIEPAEQWRERTERRQAESAFAELGSGPVVVLRIRLFRHVATRSCPLSPNVTASNRAKNRLALLLRHAWQNVRPAMKQQASEHLSILWAQSRSFREAALDSSF
jgi:amidase